MFSQNFAKKENILKLKTKKMKFKQIIGRVEGTSFVQFKIKNGDNNESIGDQMWISKDGEILELSENASEELIEETIELFDRSSRKAFKGALRRLEII